MDRKSSLWYKLISPPLALVLVLRMLAGCDGEEEEEASTPTAATSAMPTATEAVAPSSPLLRPFMQNPDSSHKARAIT